LIDLSGLVELAWEVGGWVLEGVVESLPGEGKDERSQAGEAPYLPLPEVEYHERSDPPHRQS